MTERNEKMQQRPHALIVPLPSQGHITPLLRLARQIALRGFKVTFVNTERNQKSMAESRRTRQSTSNGSTDKEEEEEEMKKLDALQLNNNNSVVRFVSISDGLAPDVDFSRDASREAFPRVVQGTKEHGESVLERMIMEEQVSLVVADLFLLWPLQLAATLGIPSIPFFPMSATVLCLLLQHDQFDAADANNLSRPIDESASFEPTELECLLQPGKQHIQKEHIKDMVAALKSGECILVNSFVDLEGSALSKVAGLAGTPIKAVGPLLPPLILHGSGEDDIAADGEYADCNLGLGSEALAKEDSECLDWLDTQSPRSVLYISFGSKAVPSAADFEKLALGIQTSRVPFLWVIREDMNAKLPLPTSFRKYTQAQGIVVTWSPQLQVLAHASIGAFLTHSGWNSTIEGIYMGVPMLSFPILADQAINCAMVSRSWKLGLSLKGLDVECVAQQTKELFHGESREPIMHQVLDMKCLARKALSTSCGSSSKNLDDFVRQYSQVSK